METSDRGPWQTPQLLVLAPMAETRNIAETGDFVDSYIGSVPQGYS